MRPALVVSKLFGRVPILVPRPDAIAAGDPKGVKAQLAHSLLRFEPNRSLNRRRDVHTGSSGSKAWS